MKRLIHILTLVLLCSHSRGQIFAELHVDIFRPKNVKTVYTYFKSQDTLRDKENDHKILERKTEYYRNGVIKTDLQMNFLNSPLDTCPYKTYSLNPDSTIKSERSYFTSEHKWLDQAFYKYTDKYSYEIDYGKHSKVIRAFNPKGKIIREKDFRTKNDFTIYDFVYDSLDRLIQYFCYPMKDDKYKVQTLFLFTYSYKQKSDSLFCTSTEYIIQVSNKTWQKMQNDLPMKCDLKNPDLKVELRPNYKTIVFNNRYEIIGDYNCWRYETDNHPYSKNWTRRTYVYEYY